MSGMPEDETAITAAKLSSIQIVNLALASNSRSYFLDTTIYIGILSAIEHSNIRDSGLFLESAQAYTIASTEAESKEAISKGMKEGLRHKKWVVTIWKASQKPQDKKKEMKRLRTERTHTNSQSPNRKTKVNGAESRNPSTTQPPSTDEPLLHTPRHDAPPRSAQIEPRHRNSVRGATAAALAAGTEPFTPTHDVAPANPTPAEFDASRLLDPLSSRCETFSDYQACYAAYLANKKANHSRYQGVVHRVGLEIYLNTAPSPNPHFGGLDPEFFIASGDPEIYLQNHPALPLVKDATNAEEKRRQYPWEVHGRVPRKELLQRPRLRGDTKRKAHDGDKNPHPRKSARRGLQYPPGSARDNLPNFATIRAPQLKNFVNLYPDLVIPIDPDTLTASSAIPSSRGAAKKSLVFWKYYGYWGDESGTTIQSKWCMDSEFSIINESKKNKVLPTAEWRRRLNLRHRVPWFWDLGDDGTRLREWINRFPHFARDLVTVDVGNLDDTEEGNKDLSLIMGLLYRVFVGQFSSIWRASDTFMSNLVKADADAVRERLSQMVDALGIL
ncbi:hypothetical protein BS50DRAFT_633189 [Corynespora cassiicola Philippines]|uniref:Uncharacterized protein n=1 Tax=Corynespora cassiicola Philippines TaxID=1448308 RepID=A0A2T2NVQ3_CORCC|nr:hypothetical protein BS50DRAFT_633189 [Corynespora cassiicola Philippines]